MPNTRSASHLSDSGTLLVLAARVFLDCRALLGDDNYFRRHVQHSDNHSRVETLGPIFRPSLAWRACTRSSTPTR